MAQVTRTTSKGYFNTGDTPTEAQFADTLDSVKWYDEVDSASVQGTQINASTSKTTPVDTDNLAGTDSASSHILVRFTWANIKAAIKSYLDSLTTTFTNKTISGTSNTLSNISADSTIDGTNNKVFLAAEKTKLAGIATGATAAETTTTHGALINTATAKTTPVDADLLGLVDTEASNIIKKLSWANVKASFKTYYDSIASTFTNKSISGSTNTFTDIPQSAITNLSTDLAAKADAIDEDYEAITYAASKTVAYDPEVPNKKMDILTGDTDITITGITTDSSGTFKFTQDGTGNRTVTINTVSVPVNPNINKSTIVGWKYDSVEEVFDFDTNYQPSVTNIAFTGTNTKTLTVTFSDGRIMTANFNDINTGVVQLSTPTLTATPNPTSIDLSWTNVSNESSYKLEWSANGTTGWTQIGGTIAANTTTYSHIGLSPSTQYFYRITAVGDGTSFSDSAYGTTDTTTASNLLLSPTDFSNTTHWTRDAIHAVNTNVANDSDGSLTADKVIPNAVSGGHILYQVITGHGVGAFQYKVEFKADGYDHIYMLVANSSFANRSEITANLTLGTRISQGSGTFPLENQITSKGNGWYELLVRADIDTTGSVLFIYLRDTSNSGTYAGDTTSGILFAKGSVSPYVA